MHTISKADCAIILIMLFLLIMYLHLIFISQILKAVTYLPLLCLGFINLSLKLYFFLSDVLVGV